MLSSPNSTCSFECCYSFVNWNETVSISVHLIKILSEYFNHLRSYYFNKLIGRMTIVLNKMLVSLRLLLNAGKYLMLLSNNIIIMLYFVILISSSIFQIVLIYKILFFFIILIHKLLGILRLKYFLLMRIKAHAQYIIINIFNKRLKLFLWLFYRIINWIMIQFITLII